jgi:hypothetical protein
MRRFVCPQPQQVRMPPSYHRPRPAPPWRGSLGPGHAGSARDAPTHAQQRAAIRRWARCVALAVACGPLGALAALAQTAGDEAGEAGATREAAASEGDAAGDTAQGGAVAPRAAISPEAQPAGTPGTSGVEPAPATGYRWRGPPPTEPDRDGALRDAGYFLSYQLVAVGALYLMPQSMSGWTDEEKSNYSFDKWRHNVTHPVFDNDAWYINWILHPYWGGAYYIRARERGLDKTESFWFSTVMSLLWEYGAEALAEPVSITDIVVTPVLGSLLGEYVFAPWRARIRARTGELDWSDKVILTLTDPLGVINAQIDSWFGVKSSVQVAPMGLRTPLRLRESGFAAAAPASGKPSGWALQIRVDW